MAISEDPFDPKNLTLPATVAGEKRTLKSTEVAADGKRFVKGPIPVDVIARATRAHRAGLAILLAVKMATDMRDRRRAKDGYVRVTADLCAGLNIPERMRRRAITALEAAGLVEVKRHQRSATQVRPVAGLFPKTVNEDNST